MEEYIKAKIEWVKTKDSSDMLHHSYIVDLLEHISETREVSTETAKKLLYHQEASKAEHKKQGRYMKPPRAGMLKELIIPAPNSSDPEGTYTIKDEKAIETLLLRRNKLKLTEENISPFSTGPLAEMMDKNGRCKIAKSIVEGTFDINEINKLDVKNKKELKLVIQTLRRKKDKNGKWIKMSRQK